MVPRLPLPTAALFFAAGLLIPVESPPPVLLFGALSLLALTTALIALATSGRGARPGLRRTLGCLLLPAAFLPLGRFVAAVQPRLHGTDDIRRLLSEEGGKIPDPIDLEGELHADPYRFPAPAGGCSLEIDLHRLRRAGLFLRAGGVARIRIPPAPEGTDDPCELIEGTGIRLAATLALPRSFGNPGAYDYAAYLNSTGVRATGRAPSARLHRVTERPGLFERAIGAARKGVRASFRRAFRPAESGQARAIEEAILLGVRDRVPQRAAEALRRAGTSHLLAISGFHVAVLSLCVWRISRGLPLGPTGRLAILLLALGGYLMLTSRAPSVLRAVACAGLHVAGRLVGLRAVPFNTIAVVFIALTALHPSLLLGNSFRLSFLAAAALAAFLPPIARLPRARHPLAASAAINAVALLSTSPLTIFLFNRSTPGALLANLAAAPLMGTAFALGLAIPAADLLTHLIEGAGVAFRSSLSPVEIVGMIAGACIEGAILLSRWIAELPGMSYHCVTPEPLWVAAALGCCGVAAIEGLPGRLRTGAVILFLLILILIALPLESAPLGAADGIALRAAVPVLRATVLDVGHGSATLIETPAGRRLLVDGGGFAGTTFDVGERVVARALLTLGIRRLDAVAASHADVDHIGGLRSIVEIFGGEELWLPAGGLEEPALKRLAAEGLTRGRVLRLLACGQLLRFGGARIRVLHPPGTHGRASDNERSLVLRIEAGGAGILLPGDIGARSEERILPALLPTAILVVPHHGGRGSTSARLLERLQPSVAIISCGARSPHGHPHEETVERLRRAGARILRTDRHGALRVEIPVAAGRPAGHPRTCRYVGGRWIPLERPGEEASRGRTDRVGDEAGGQHQSGQNGQSEP